MKNFGISGHDFVMNDVPYRVLAGAMHYFRVPPEYWDDRLAKLKNMGLNTVETYVAWNLHEPQPGKYDFDGILDIVTYIEKAAEHGLNVIVRPGPYICSEWELGGLPSWLLKDSGMQLRCAYQPYLDAVDRFFDNFLPLLRPLQVSSGGPVIAVQIENEYGSYGNDAVYLRHLENSIRNSGIDCLLFTSDGPRDVMLQGGTLPHILKTVNFGSKAGEAFDKLHEYQPTGPKVCMEFWNGWFDHWGEEHHTRSPEDAALALDEILATGASVCLYMFHGGTNFGFMNGANYGDVYAPTITSYDDDAPLNECGDPTPKYWALRDVIEKYVELPEKPDIPIIKKSAYGTVEMTECVPLMNSLEQLSEPTRIAKPVPMETLDQDYGFILYRTLLSGPRGEQEIIIKDIHDRAHIFADDQLLGIRERERPQENLKVDVTSNKMKLDILVENMGRVNYGHKLHDRKGITEHVALGYQLQFDWEVFPLPLDDLTELNFSAGTKPAHLPAFFRGFFQADKLTDTFLSLPGWSKGVCWLNGFNLGRYWERGPQKTLYIPAPVLNEGSNELIILELDGLTDGAIVELRDTFDLG